MKLVLVYSRVHKSTFCKQLTTEYGGTNPHFQSENEEVVTSLKENVLEGIKRLLTESVSQAEESKKKVRDFDFSSDLSLVAFGQSQNSDRSH